MKLGIIGAMDREIKSLYEKLEDSHTETILGVPFYIGKLYGKEVVIVKSGVGKVNAALGTIQLINNFNVTHIINTGIAGAMQSGLGIFDFVISERAVYHDVDVTQFGYKIGQLPDSDQFFTANPELIKIAQKAWDISGNSAKHKLVTGLIASGDQFISGGDRKQFIKKTFDPACVEMEGASIAHTATLNKVPFIIIRCMSDMADDNIETVYKFNEDEAALVSAQFIENIVKCF